MCYSFPDGILFHPVTSRWERGLPPSTRAPGANSGGDRCRVWVGLGRRVRQWVRRPSTLGCGLAACRQVASAGQKLRDGTDVFIIVGLEGLHHVFGDPNPFLAKKGQAGKTHASRPTASRPQRKQRAVSPQAPDSLPGLRLSLCGQPAEPSLSCEVALLGRLLQHKITWIFLGG